MSKLFPHLFTPFELGPLRVRNRIFIPGHATALSVNSQVGDELIAYKGYPLSSSAVNM